MSISHKVLNSHGGRVAGVLLLTALVGVGAAPPAAQAKSRVSYKPGVAIVPEVMQADGHSRTYNTPNGPSLWTDGLPVQMGDKIKLNVFAATGGSDLKRIIVRIDNTRLVQIPKAPWSTILDTARMTAGPHMVEVFAETTGDRPLSATKTQSFFITKDLPTQFAYQQSTVPYKVGGSRQESGGPETDPATNPNYVPDVPEFLKGQSVDESATVSVRARSGVSPADPASGGSTVSDSDTPVTINEPTLFFVEPAQGSTAKNYAYALVRNGRTISASTEPQELVYNAIKIQKRSATTAGLGSGPLTLYVWGIDDQKRPSNPAKAQISIP